MKTTTCIAALLILAAALPAWAGPLTPVACDPSMALSAKPLYITGSAFKLGKGAAGLVSSQALVGTARANGTTLMVAIDSSKSGASAPDVLRFDFSGKGNFKGAPTAKLKQTNPSSRYYTANFGPIEVKATINGKATPVTVKGHYIKSGNFRRLQIFLGTAVEGKCRFGGKELSVRIIDGNNNLRVGDAWKRRSFGRNITFTPGDTIAVDLGDGTFSKSVRNACYGSPIEVDGKWYMVRASADGKQVAATPVPMAGGKIHIAHPKWSAMLIGDKYVLPLEGGPKPQALPAGKYDLRSYEEFSAPDGQGRRAQLTVSPRGSAASKITVAPGKTTELAIGSPLKASIKATKRGSQIRLSLVMTDAAGRHITRLTTYGGQRPPKPTVIIKDSTGKQVYQNSLEYG